MFDYLILFKINYLIIIKIIIQIFISNTNKFHYFIIFIIHPVNPRGLLSWEFFIANPRWWSIQWPMKSFALKSIALQAHQFDNPEYRFKLLAGIAFSTNRWICSRSNRLCRNLLMVGPINPGPMYSPMVFPFHCRT